MLNGGCSGVCFDGKRRVCAIATLKTYLQTAIEKGCSDEFVNDMVLVLREFERFQSEDPQKVKIPD